MTEGPRYVTFRDYLRVVRERRLLILAISLLFVAGALTYSLRQDPLYAAEASLDFRDDNLETSLVNRPLIFSGETREARAAIGAQLVGKPEVAEEVKKRLKSPRSVESLQSSISGRAEARTSLVVLEGTAGTAREAAELTNAAAEAVRRIERRRARGLYEQAADAQTRVLKDLNKQKGAQFSRLVLRQDIAKLEELAGIADPVVIVRPAAVPAAPIRPKPVRTTLLGLLVGLTVGLLAAFVRDSVDRRFKSSHDITEELHFPLLGFVREPSLGKGLIEGERKAMTEQELEGFRILRTNVEFLDVDAPPKLVLVTSALPEEGKSTISVALAGAYATAGKRTLLIESDLRRPTVSSRLGVGRSPGLSDYLVGQATPTEVLQTVALPSQVGNGHGPVATPESVPLVVIAAGSPTPQPAELLRSRRCKELFEQVKEVYDVVVVDSCPLLSVVDTLELIPIADAVVVCVRASQTTRDQARAAKNALGHFPPRPTGVVVTGIRANDEAASYGYYSYGYVYGGESGQKK